MRPEPDEIARLRELVHTEYSVSSHQVRTLFEEYDRLRAKLAAAEAMNEMVFTWWDREGNGPDYSPYTSDTHPERQRVWSEWYDGNIKLAGEFMRAMKAARTPTPSQEANDDA